MAPFVLSVSQFLRPNEDIMPERYHAFFHQFLEAWLTRRSERDTLALIGEDCTGFGTGADEVAVADQDQEGALTDRDLYARDIHDAPNRVHYDVRMLSIRTLCHATGVIMATLDLRTTILSQDVAFYGLRVTFVVSDGPDGLKLRHDHVSFPTSLHRRGESFPIKELEERMKVFERMLHERTQTLEQAYAALAVIVDTDKLTGITSRRKLDEVVEAELQRLRRYGTGFSILFFDIDKFKSFNDRYGHARGDEMLRDIAKAVGHCVRETDTFGRWGGDEFLILLPQTMGCAAGELAQRVVESVEALVTPEGKAVGISLGLVTAGVEDTLETLLARVDAAMYRAKAQGGGQWVSEQELAFQDEPEENDKEENLKAENIKEENDQ
jgi:diguanylate cyclase (GGDEF)-like protein